MRTWRSLPDAPSVKRPTQAEKFQTFVDVVRSPLTPGRAGINAGVMREWERGRVIPGWQPSFIAPYKAAFTPKESRTFSDKYLYPSLLQRSLRYHPSTSSSFMGRAAYAASRIFIMHDDSGNGRLNTSYFFGVLTSVTMQTAYRPYLGAIHFGDLQQFWFDDWQRRGDQPAPRVWAWHPTNGNGPLAEICV
jgi:hypothetical protein